MPIPPYVAHLRDRIGTDLLWLPGVTAVVLDHEGEQILLGRRADSGEWALLSGILDPGEEPAVGIVREVREETGVDVVVEALAAVTVTEQVRYPNGDLSQYLDLCFVCRPADAEAAQHAYPADEESLEVAWFGVDEIPEPFAATSSVRLDRTLDFMLAPHRGPWLGPAGTPSG